MKYGPVNIAAANGAILAHSFKPQNGPPIKKGTVLTAAELDRIASAGAESIIVAMLEPGDVGEDEAARRLADAVKSKEIEAHAAATGRVNLYARTNGLFSAEPEIVDSINRVDPGITFATLPTNSEVTEGRLVATVKIIPYAVPGAALDGAITCASRPPMRLIPYRAKRVGLVATQLPQLKPSTMDKTRRILEKRLTASGSAIVNEIRTGHDPAGVWAAIMQLLPDCDIVIVFGASAICDIDDVIPDAIRRAGGEIVHFGMPVDPGNLLLVGKIGEKPVIGAPGCARSPAENGFDWVLQRSLAGVGITASEITGMGVGGLLMEIGSRPQPRETESEKPASVACVILAAGQSRRMGERNKLLEDIHGKAMVRHAVEAALASGAKPVTVVTGHQKDRIAEVLENLDIHFAHNPDYESGLASSLRAGIASVPHEHGAVLIMLGDMPGLNAGMIGKMLKSYKNAPAGSIVVATSQGKRGNPVIWPRRYFDALMSVEGDVGARHLIGENAENVITVELGEPAALDIDTPAALQLLRSQSD